MKVKLKMCGLTRVHEVDKVVIRDGILYLYTHTSNRPRVILGRHFTENIEYFATMGDTDG